MQTLTYRTEISGILDRSKQLERSACCSSFSPGFRKQLQIWQKLARKCIFLKRKRRSQSRWKINWALKFIKGPSPTYDNICNIFSSDKQDEFSISFILKNWSPIICWTIEIASCSCFVYFEAKSNISWIKKLIWVQDSDSPRDSSKI